MPRQSSKWIAALVSLLLTVLPVVIGVLSGLLTSHRGFFDYFNDHPWSTLSLAIVGLTLALVYLNAWQQRNTKEPRYASEKDARPAIGVEILEVNSDPRTFTVITNYFQKTISGERAEASRKIKAVEKERDEAKESAVEMAARIAQLATEKQEILTENKLLEGKLRAIVSVALAQESERR